MPDSSAARTEILRRILAATGAPHPPHAIEALWQGIRREYKHHASEPYAGLLHQLEDRLRDYDAGVYHCTSSKLRPLIETILRERGKHRLAVPQGLPAEWLPPGFSFEPDLRNGHAAIDSCDGVLTSATLAIAETGTIVLQDAPGQGRRAVTLLPDYHLCIVNTTAIVQTVPEAMAKLQRTAGLATTFFSGPSATADIEMTRIKGVHGPRFVDVVLLDVEL